MKWVVLFLMASGAIAAQEAVYAKWRTPNSNLKYNIRHWKAGEDNWLKWPLVKTINTTNANFWWTNSELFSVTWTNSDTGQEGMDGIGPVEVFAVQTVTNSP